MTGRERALPAGRTSGYRESYERIHRTNLVMMGMLPLQFLEGENPRTLGLSGTETFHIPVDESLVASQRLMVRAESQNGSSVEFEAIVRIDTPIEVDYYRHVEFSLTCFARWRVRELSRPNPYCPLWVPAPGFPNPPRGNRKLPASWCASW